MKKIATTFALLALCATSAFASNPVRISQVYGGGGGGSSYYGNDYIELFNSSGTAVNIGGWSLQYGSATGTSFGSAAINMFVFPAGASIAPCSYVLIQTSAPLNGVGLPLPVPADYSTTNVNMSGTTGKIALINNAVGNNACAGNTVGGVFVDVVGYGTGNCFETADAVGTTQTQGLVRNANGITDTDSNLSDFTLVTNPVPRNSSSPQNTECLATPVSNSSWGQVKSLYR